MPATLDPTTTDGGRALERLTGERMAWLTTVDPEGMPQSSPIWFLWQDGEVLVYSWIRAPRNENIRERPLVAFHLETEDGGDAYVTMEGTARIDPDGPPASTVPAFMAKYASIIEGYGWPEGYYDEHYPVLIRITPRRWRVG